MVARVEPCRLWFHGSSPRLVDAWSVQFRKTAQTLFMATAGSETQHQSQPRRRRRMVARRWLTWLIALGCVLVGTGLLTFHVSLWRARVAIEDRRHSAAERWLSVARCCWPANGEWHFLSVIVSRRAGEYERTKRELKKAFDLGAVVN